MLRSYVRLVLFAFGLLVGVQVPGYMTDYLQRVDAHRLEAQAALAEYRKTADQFFEGDMDRLVAHYRTSDDPVFQRDADSLGVLIRRERLFETEWMALQGPWYSQAWQILVHSNPEIRQETLERYRYQVVLTPDSIAWGLVCAVLIAWLVELLAVLLAVLILPRHHARHRT